MKDGPGRIQLALLICVCVTGGLAAWRALGLRSTTSPAPCIANNLHVAFRGGGPIGSGTLVGDLVVRNVGAKACMLSGSVTAAALDGHGQAIVAPWLLEPKKIRPRALLTAHAPASVDELPVPNNVGFELVILAGRYVNDDGQPCGSHETHPDTWRLDMLNHSWTVPNYDPVLPSEEPGSHLTALFACRAGFSIYDS
jgi:hypothetical protein